LVLAPGAGRERGRGTRLLAVFPAGLAAVFAAGLAAVFAVPLAAGLAVDVAALFAVVFLAVVLASVFAGAACSVPVWAPRSKARPLAAARFVIRNLRARFIVSVIPFPRTSLQGIFCLTLS
jgi:uncharacterized membrane protein YphA (DoxX/SURF4 family)